MTDEQNIIRDIILPYAITCVCHYRWRFGSVHVLLVIKLNLFDSNFNAVRSPMALRMAGHVCGNETTSWRTRKRFAYQLRRTRSARIRTGTFDYAVLQ